MAAEGRLPDAVVYYQPPVGGEIRPNGGRRGICPTIWNRGFGKYASYMTQLEYKTDQCVSWQLPTPELG
jgi:hypothetical protein